MKRPIGLAIAFTLALSFLSHSPQPEIHATPMRARPATLPPAQPSVHPEGGSVDSETNLETLPSTNPELKQAEPHKLDMPHRIASLVPGVERFLEAATGK